MHVIRTDRDGGGRRREGGVNDEGGSRRGNGVQVPKSLAQVRLIAHFLFLDGGLDLTEVDLDLEKKKRNKVDFQIVMSCFRFHIGHIGQPLVPHGHNSHFKHQKIKMR